MVDANSAKTVILSQYPISAEEKRELTDNLQCKIDLLSVSTIISKGHLQLIYFLRSLKYQRVAIYISNPQEKPFFEALIILSKVIGAEQIIYIQRGGPGTIVGWYHVILAAIKISLSLLLAFPVILFLYMRCVWLTYRPRILPTIESWSSKSITYIKMTLWLGIQSGGAQTHARGIVESLSEKGYDINIVTSEPIEFQMAGRELPVHFSPLRHSYVSPREINHFLTHFFNLIDLKYFNKLKNCGIIYQRLSVGNFLGVELSRTFNRPLVVEYNGSEKWLSENWGTSYFFKFMVEKIEKVTLRHAHLIVAVSNALKDELINNGYDAERIEVVPNGFNQRVFSNNNFGDDHVRELKKSLTGDSKAVVFSFVGTFGPWHGTDVLADAIVHYFETYQSDIPDEGVKFLFVGDGVRKKGVNDILEPYIADNRVLMVGSVPHDRVVQYLAASDVCIVPTRRNRDKSEFFGSPTKLFEYLAAGKPIIASPEGQVRDVLLGSLYVSEFEDKMDPADPKQIGIFFESENEIQLAQAIDFAARNRKWRIAAGLNARIRAHENYTWDHATAKIIGALKRLEYKQAEENSYTRVLINGLHSVAGGGVTYLSNILPLLASRGDLDIHVLLQESQVGLYEKALDNVTVHSIPAKNGLPGLLLREQFHSWRISKKFNTNVVFSPANFGPLLTFPTVILLRNALDVGRVEKRLSKQIYWQLLKIATSVSALSATRIISVSEYAKTGLPKIILKSINNKSVTIPHGVSREFHPNENIPIDEKRLLFVSDIYVQKNLHTLVRAMGEIVQHTTVFLDVVGAPRDKGYLSEVESIISEMGLTQNVNFAGHVLPKDLQGYYSRCAICVFPSTIETFGNPLVEAMASGTAIVCSNTAAMPEVAGDAVAYFNPEDASELAATIIKLLSDKGALEELRKRALLRSKIYSWENTANKTAQTLIDAAESS